MISLTYFLIYANFGLNLFLFFLLVSWDLKLGSLRFFKFNMCTDYYKFPSQICFCSIPWVLVCCDSIFIDFKIIFDSFISFLIYWLIRSTPFSFHMSVDIPVFLMLLISGSKPLWSEKILGATLISLSFKTCLVSYNLIYILECSICSWEECVLWL